jgi:integrase
MPLTDTAIRTLKPAAKSYRKSDERGLYLEIYPSGAKLWRFKYRFLDKEKRVALGAYPDVSLALARKKRDAFREQLAQGIDPSMERKRERLVAKISAANTFKEVAEEYIDTKLRKEGKAQVTIDKAHWLVSQFAAISDLPVSEIKPIEVLAVLKRLEGVRKHETAKRCRSFASRVFRYAVATSRAETDPAALLTGALIAPKVKHHAALIDPVDVGALLRAIDAYSGAPITRLALQIAPHVLARPGELRMANWREFDFEAATWKVPEERMKMRRPHVVPLSRQVIGYLIELQQYSGPTGFVFPAFHTSRRPMSENTMNQAFRRMGYANDDVTAHGLRTTGSTLLNESGKWSPDAIERALAHADSNAVRGIYNRGQYWAERVEMMQWWSDYLDMLRDGAAILPFNRKA